MDPDSSPTTPPPSPPIWRWVIGFLMVGMCWGLVSFHPPKKNKINLPPQKNNSLTIPPPPSIFPSPIDNPFYAQSRSPSRLPKNPTTAPYQLEQEYLLLAKKKTSSNLVRGERFTPESKICDSFTLECYGECMVFFVDWAGWYVIIIFFISLSFLSSDSSVIALSLSAAAVSFGLTTTKKQKSLFAGLD